MATTKKERIADLLRAEAQSEAADRLLGVGARGWVEFGPNVTVYVSENVDGSFIDVGINWSALGTVSAEKTAQMAHFLALAATLAQNIQAIIDDSYDGSTS